jgi:acetoacetyl-CoA synthetase
MSDEVAVWSPTPDRRERANVTRFLRWLADQEHRRFDSYEQLWRWSVEDPGAFWEAVWRFYEVSSPTPRGTALAEAVIPGARWFEGARLNYAEAVLARAPALHGSIVHVGEDGVVSELTIDELRGQVGALGTSARRSSAVASCCRCGRARRRAGGWASVPTPLTRMRTS